MKLMIKQFTRCRVLCFSFILTFVVTWGFLLFFSSLGMSGFSILHTMARFNFYFCFLIAVLSFYFISRANRFWVKESVDAAGGKAAYEKSAGIFLLLCILIWNFFSVSILCIASETNDGTGYFLGWFPLNYIVNILIPQLICLLISFLAAAGKNYYRNAVVELLFLFLVSPLAEGFRWTEKDSGFFIDFIYQYVRWPFTIFYQNGVWSPDFQNGFQVESVRILVSMFWIALLSAGIMFLVYRRKAFAAILGMASVLMLACSYQPASLYRLNDNWNGMFVDYTDYNLFEQDNRFKEQPEINYEVKSYDLKLDFGSELSVEGKLRITAEEERKEFLFTLYHGFKINHVESVKQGESIQFAQEKDSFTVTCENPVRELELLVNYKGHHNKFYANSAAAMLPGWLPWYPMAGTKQIFLEYEDFGRMYGYNPYNRIPEADIRIASNRGILTNLGKSRSRSFQGRGDSITVLGGNLLDNSADVSAVRDILPLQLMKGTTAEGEVKTLEDEFETVLDIMDKEYGVDLSELQGYDIYVASKDLGRNVINNNIAVFKDYILAVPGYLTPDEMLKYMVLSDVPNSSRRKESAVIRFFMLNVNFSRGCSGIVEDIGQAFEFMEEDSQDSQEYLELRQMIQEKAEAMGTEAFGKAVVSYLLEPDQYADDQEFLEGR